MLDRLSRRELFGRIIGGAAGAYSGYLTGDIFARDGSIDLTEHEIQSGNTKRIRDPFADVVTTITGTIVGQELGGAAARYRPKKSSI